MPKYRYQCKECKEDFTIWHSMKDKLTDCEKCDIVDTLVRIPLNFTTTVKTKDNTTKKPGEIVKSSIEEFKKDLKEEQKRRKKQEYSVDE